MTADPMTPGRGIRLKGDAPIPPAPGWGVHRPVTRSSQDDRHIGAVVEITYGHHVPVCMAPECLRALHPQPTYAQGKKALRDHWDEKHAGGAARPPPVRLAVRTSSTSTPSTAPSASSASRYGTTPASAAYSTATSPPAGKPGPATPPTCSSTGPRSSSSPTTSPNTQRRGQRERHRKALRLPRLHR